MYRRFLNARSPLRLLEKGLHGGLGHGNLGLVIAGPGVGKTSFLVGVALDELLRSKPVLHIALDHSVQHVRDYYDTVFEELANTTRLDENHVVVRAEIDRLVDAADAPGTVTPRALVVLEQKVRPEARDTLAYFAEQGVRCVIISGDIHSSDWMRCW